MTTIAQIYRQQDKSVDSLGLSSTDEQCWMDLEPFAHPHPHRVPLNASLPFIFQLFRGLGLRYLTVVNDDNKAGLFGQRCKGFADQHTPFSSAVLSLERTLLGFENVVRTGSTKCKNFILLKTDQTNAVIRLSLLADHAFFCCNCCSCCWVLPPVIFS